jgi:GntR family transcriptional repressor for pyruvate dehydrogenase complex
MKGNPELGDHGPADIAWLDVLPLADASDDAHSRLPERVAARIEALVGAERIEPGGRLPAERDLARIFGVSRPSIREAVQRLEARGLVVVKHGVGVFVATPPVQASGPAVPPALASPTAASVSELFDVRRLLEPAAAEWAALRADGPAIARLRLLAQRFDAAVGAAERRFDLLAEYDVQVHLEVVHHADNALLARLVGQLQDLQQLQLEWSLRRPGRLEETSVEHGVIVAAIADRRAKDARVAMHDHLDASAAAFHAALAAAPDVD